MSLIATSFGMIRPWRHDDNAALVQYANNKAIWRMMRNGFPHPFDQAAAQAFLMAVSRQIPVTFFAVATVEQAIGGIGVTPGSDVHQHSAELAYWLGEPFWGRGYATEAIQRFTSYAFVAYNLIRIYAQPYATNIGSIRALEKAGYQLEGRMRYNVLKEGRLLDQLLYATIRAAALDDV